jgi:molecular chaperone GrpE
MMGKRKKDEKQSMKNTVENNTATQEAEERDGVESEKTEIIGDVTADSTTIQGLNEQVSELNDRYLRLYSEFDNYRKRTLKEKAELSKYASAEIITRLLPVLDDFERAIKAYDESSDAGKSLKEGVVLIFNKFLSILNQQGLEQMRTAGESFDTDFHEAITNIPAATAAQKGKIVDEVEKGYLLNGKVIRYAKVVVGS